MLHDVKGKLARLLATENLIIEHRPVETASFDVVRRVLTLPIWKISSNEIYDLLVAHEVGHALYTDSRDWTKEELWSDIPHSFVNIVEDARIEKLMKRRYAGLNKTFYRGYSQMNEEDFFNLEDEDLSKLSFVDRVNLWFKIGSFIKVPINDDREKEIINIISSTETFDDVLNASKILSDFAKQKENDAENVEIPNQSSVDNSQSSESSSQSTEQTSDSSNDSQPEDSDSTEENSSPGETGGQTPKNDGENDGEKDTEESSTNSELESKTANSLEEKLQDLVHSRCDDDYISYVTIPQRDLSNHIVPCGEIHDSINKWWQIIEQGQDQEEWGVSDEEYQKFKKNSIREVNYLVKEFECKKAASSYSRASVSRTGILDCTKLHTYKYNEDLFKKVTVLPDGKNHGLLFILDWSGSMADYLNDTIKQMYNLIWFCRKVNIPYNVYAFTNEWFHTKREEESYKQRNNLIDFNRKENELNVSNYFSMLNILSSETSTKDLDQQMKNIWRISFSFSYRSYVSIPPGLGLSGTPLNEALIMLHNIIPDFKRKSGVEKINCVVLTDGEANVVPRTIKMTDPWSKSEVIRTARVTDRVFLRNKKTGNIRKLTMNFSGFTDILIDDIKESFSGVNIVGFRVVGNGQFGNMLHQQGVEYQDREKYKNLWRKDKSIILKKQSGYNSYYIISSNTLNSSVDFDVESEASKTQIKNAFKRSLSSKKMNKKILSEFVDIIA